MNLNKISNTAKITINQLLTHPTSQVETANPSSIEKVQSSVEKRAIFVEDILASKAEKTLIYPLNSSSDENSLTQPDVVPQLFERIHSDNQFQSELDSSIPQPRKSGRSQLISRTSETSSQTLKKNLDARLDQPIVLIPTHQHIYEPNSPKLIQHFSQINLDVVQKILDEASHPKMVMQKVDETLLIYRRQTKTLIHPDSYTGIKLQVLKQIIAGSLKAQLHPEDLKIVNSDAFREGFGMEKVKIVKDSNCNSIDAHVQSNSFNKCINPNIPPITRSSPHASARVLMPPSPHFVLQPPKNPDLYRSHITPLQEKEPIKKKVITSAKDMNMQIFQEILNANNTCRQNQHPVEFSLTSYQHRTNTSIPAKHLQQIKDQILYLINSKVLNAKRLNPEDKKRSGSKELKEKFAETKFYIQLPPKYRKVKIISDIFDFNFLNLQDILNKMNNGIYQPRPVGQIIDKYLKNKNISLVARSENEKQALKFNIMERTLYYIRLGKLKAKLHYRDNAYISSDYFTKKFGFYNTNLYQH